MSTAAQPQTKPTTGYDVARPLGKCHVSGRTIEPGMRYMAALRETLTGLERLDISTEAWQEFDRKDVLAFWQAVMPAAQQVKKKVFVDDQVLCELFERLGTTTEPAKLNFRFVLGLILMRKRMVQYESTRKDESREIWQVRFKGRQDLLDLVNPQLAEDQVAAVSQQLGEILNEEL